MTLQEDRGEIMTLQEIFDKAFIGLRSQGFSLSINNVGCRYRTFDEDGRVIARCAIGWCIPDEKYDPAMEGSVAQSDVVLAAIGLPGATVSLRSELSELQGCHDGSHGAVDMEERLRRFAARNALTVPQ